jgi:membrane-associated phospholipid phosphatase
VPARWYWDPIRDFAADTVADSGHLLCAPGDWNGRDWALAGVTGGVVIAAGLLLDDPVQRYSQAHRNQGSDRLAKYANPLGTISSFGVLGACGLAGVTLDDERGKAVFVDGLEATVITSGIITPAIKFVAGRSRPDAEQGTHHFRPFSDSASFPSGHATQAFAVASVVAAVYDDHPWVAPVAFAGAGLVGFARINDNQHFLSDVLVGGLIGTLVGYEVVHLDRTRAQARAMTITPVIDASEQGILITWYF